MEYEQINCTILSKEELEKLNLLEKKAIATDFAIMSGVQYGEMFSFKSKCSCYWTSSFLGEEGLIEVISSNNPFGTNSINNRNVGVRPAIKLKNNSDIIKYLKFQPDGTVIIDGCYFPQEYASSVSDNLDKMFDNGILNETDFAYTRVRASVSKERKQYKKMHKSKKINFVPEFFLEQNKVYEYDGKNYIKANVNFLPGGIFTNISNVVSNCTLNNGGCDKLGDSVWLKVEPIKWLYFKEAQILLSEKILFSGFSYDELYYYINKYFVKDIFQFSPLKIDNTSMLLDVNDGEHNLDGKLDATVDKDFLSEGGMNKSIFLKADGSVENFYKKFIKNDMEDEFNMIPNQDYKNQTLDIINKTLENKEDIAGKIVKSVEKKEISQNKNDLIFNQISSLILTKDYMMSINSLLSSSGDYGFVLSPESLIDMSADLKCRLLKLVDLYISVDIDKFNLQLQELREYCNSNDFKIELLTVIKQHNVNYKNNDIMVSFNENLLNASKNK